MAGKQTEFLARNEMDRILGWSWPSKNQVIGERNRAILWTLYSSGINVGEIVGLDLADVDYIGELLRIRGSGNKERANPVPSTTLRWIRTYCELSLAMRGARKPEEPLFLNQSGGRMSEEEVTTMMAEHPEGLTPSLLRDTFAAHMLQLGASIEAVSEFMGHESLEITQELYGHLVPQRK